MLNYKIINVRYSKNKNSSLVLSNGSQNLAIGRPPETTPKYVI